VRPAAAMPTRLPVLPRVDVPALQAIAADLDRKTPQWVITFGGYSCQFVAFAMFPHPPHQYVTAPNTAELCERMIAFEQAHRPAQA
jgi:hypothetical protein